MQPFILGVNMSEKIVRILWLDQFWKHHFHHAAGTVIRHKACRFLKEGCSISAITVMFLIHVSEYKLDTRSVLGTDDGKENDWP